MENYSDEHDDSELSNEGFSDESCQDGDSDIDESLDLNNSEDFNNYFHTRYDMYPKDESDSSLVQAVKSGYLEFVKKILDGLPSSGLEQVSIVNGARKWTEVQEKMGYDKSWTWFGDTALIAAARLGNLEMVRFLLLARADPTLESCPSDDVYETPLKAAETMKKNREQTVKKIEDGSLSLYGSEVYIDAGDKVKSILTSISIYTKIIDLLKLVECLWDKAPYSSAHHSDKRMKAFKDSPNQPKDTDSLMKALEDFDFSEQEICQGRLTDLTGKFSSIQEKNKVGRVHKYSPNLQFPRTKALPSNNSCRGINCSNLPAQNCPRASCSKCCSGECPRHSNKRLSTGPWPSAKRRW